MDYLHNRILIIFLFLASIPVNRTIDTLQLFSQSPKHSMKKRRKLTESLINQGIISKKMLEDLHSEWKEMENEEVGVL